jgi:hypothetical protein
VNIPAATAFTDAARAFQTASAASTGADTSVLTNLNALPPLCAAAIAAIRAASSAPEAATVVADCEVLLYRCSLLGDAILARRPAFTPFVVPQDMSEMVILERFYGSDAFAHVDEFEGNNPQIVGLVPIPAGTPLKMVPATV